MHLRENLDNSGSLRKIFLFWLVYYTGYVFISGKTLDKTVI